VRGLDGLADEFEVIVDKEGDIDRITLKIEISRAGKASASGSKASSKTS